MHRTSIPEVQRLPTEPDIEKIEDYLLQLKKKGASEADFKLTVEGLRLLFRCEGLDDRAIRLPQLPSNSTSRWTLLRLANDWLLHTSRKDRHLQVIRHARRTHWVHAPSCGPRSPMVRSSLEKRWTFQVFPDFHNLHF